MPPSWFLLVVLGLVRAEFGLDDEGWESPVVEEAHPGQYHHQSSSFGAAVPARRQARKKESLSYLVSLWCALSVLKEREGGLMIIYGGALFFGRASHPIVIGVSCLAPPFRFLYLFGHVRVCMCVWSSHLVGTVLCGVLKSLSLFLCQ